MADPLSISASAAGLMSLAITACRCLATYYASWKNYEKDVEKMCQHLEIVSNNMRHLQRCLDEHEFSAALKQQVEAAILACHREIKTLDTELVLIKKTEPPEDRQEKLKSLVRRATYPFKEGTLKKIQDSVIRIQTMLDSVVSILGLDSLGALNSTVTAIITDLADAKQSIIDISRDVPSIRATVDRIDQESPNISNEVVLIGSNVHDIKEDMQLIRSHLQTSKERLDALPLIQERIDTLPASLASSITLQLESHSWKRHQLQSGGLGTSEIAEKIDALGQEIKRLQLHCISKPSLLREELDNASGEDFRILNRSPKQANPAILPLQFMRKCNCHVRMDSPKICSISENFQILAKSTKAHRKGCPLSKSSEQTQTHAVGVRTIFTSRFLRKALEISLGLTHGAGGCSLSTSIKLRTLLRNDSPAFQLFDSHDLSMKLRIQEIREADFSKYMMEVLQKLKVLFSEGKASPNDINIEGQTILQLASIWTGFFTRRSNDFRPQSARKALLLNLAQMGVPLDNKDFDDNDTLGQIRVMETGPKPIAPEWQVYSSLIQLTPTPPLLGRITPIITFKIARDLEEYADLYDCGILSTAILSKDQEAVEKILQKWPCSINERNSLGQTPLHLAADWPWATNRLLAAGTPADIGDKTSLYPLNYASMVCCWAVFESLLDSGSPILAHGNGPFSWNKLGLFGLNAESLPPQTFSHLCIALADRRKRLKELATRVLSSTEQSKLISSNPGLLDSKAGEVYKTISDRYYEIPSDLQVPLNTSTVYHTPRLKPAEMSKLYDIGFREVDTQDNFGYTPFMVVVSNWRHITDVSVFEWLISKGVDPLAKIGKSGTAYIHYLAISLAGSALERLESLHRRSQTLSVAAITDFIPGLRFIIQEAGLEVKDQCQCRCSPDGCSPLHLLLNYTLSYLHLSISEESYGCADCKFRLKTLPEQEGILEKCVGDYSRSIYYFVTWVLEFVYENEGIPHSAYQNVIRLFLFLELGLTHTCLTSRHWIHMDLMPEDELHEIQEEEKETLLDLETLCKEGSALLALYEAPFYEFLNDFLSEVRARPQAKLSKENIRNIEEIGVVLEQDLKD